MGSEKRDIVASCSEYQLDLPRSRHRRNIGKPVTGIHEYSGEVQGHNLLHPSLPRTLIHLFSFSIKSSNAKMSLGIYKRTSEVTTAEVVFVTCCQTVGINRIVKVAHSAANLH